MELVAAFYTRATAYTAVETMVATALNALGAEVSGATHMLNFKHVLRCFVRSGQSAQHPTGLRF